MSNEHNALFDNLYLQYRPMVLQMCLGFVKGDALVAGDLTQEVFMNAWLALPGFKRESSYKTWIYRIAVNTCLKSLRSEKRRQVRQDVFLSLSYDSDYDRHQELYHAIGQLDELDRLIITMVLDEVAYDEIASVIGIQEGNLRVRIHRIKSKLKDLLKNGQ